LYKLRDNNKIANIAIIDKEDELEEVKPTEEITE